MIHPDLRKATKSANLELNEKVKCMQLEGRNIYHLAFGQSPFPIPDCFVKELKNYAHKNDYLPVAGTLELRQAISQWHRHEGLYINSDQIVVGTGSKELIFLVMNIFDGDVILISPGWTTYAPQVRLAKQKCHIIQTSMDDQWKLTPEKLTEFIQGRDISEQKLMILNNPGNPSGTSYTLEELEKLSRVCRQFNIIVLSDEIYGLLNFEGKHQSMAKVYPEGTLVTSGFSKWSSAGGWRVGYIIVPSLPQHWSPFMTVLQSAASQTYSCAPAPMQFALAKGLSHHEELQEYILKERKILKAMAEYCSRQLQSVGVKCITSEGGYYFMPDFAVCKSGFASNGITNGKEMCAQLLEEFEVALLPGSDFLRPENEFTVRFCFVDFDGKKAMDLLNDFKEINEDFVNAAAPRIVEGVLRLKQFVNKYK